MSADPLVRADNREATTAQQVCHLCLVEDSLATLCGAEYTADHVHHTVFAGEALCPDCGLPHCPACVALDALEKALA